MVSRRQRVRVGSDGHAAVRIGSAECQPNWSSQQPCWTPLSGPVHGRAAARVQVHRPGLGAIGQEHAGWPACSWPNSSDFHMVSPPAPTVFRRHPGRPVSRTRHGVRTAAGRQRTGQSPLTLPLLHSARWMNTRSGEQTRRPALGLGDGRRPDRSGPRRRAHRVPLCSPPPLIGFAPAYVSPAGLGVDQAVRWQFELVPEQPPRYEQSLPCSPSEAAVLLDVDIEPIVRDGGAG